MTLDHRAVPDTVRTVLDEADLHDTVTLELAFAALAANQRPAPGPSPELAALLAGAVPGRSRTRITLVAASVSAAMTLGVGAVAAANPDVRQSVNDFVTAVTTVDKPVSRSEERQGPGEVPTGPAELPAQAVTDGQDAAGDTGSPAGGGSELEDPSRQSPNGGPGRGTAREERGKDRVGETRMASEPKNTESQKSERTKAERADPEREAVDGSEQRALVWRAPSTGARPGWAAPSADAGDGRSQPGEPGDDGGSDESGAKVPPRQDDADD